MATNRLALVTLVLAPLVSAAGPAWNHADYLHSPQVLPSPETQGIDWEAAFAQATDFVSQLTEQEKVYMVTGSAGPCTGNIRPIPRLNFSGLCLSDGPLSVRLADYDSVFPAGLTVAASWNKQLAYYRGYYMGTEFKGKGVHVQLGPVAGPLGRSAYGGRNWEGFSPDPYLTGELFADTIEGIQAAGVQATAKHFIGNEQETQRNPSVDANGMTIASVSSNIDDRTLHELYLWPFQNGIKAGVAALMCSYNRVNQTYACQNSKLMNGVLKEELGFQGYVMSDWGGTHSGYLAINAGLDMDMPGPIDFVGNGPSLFGGNITTELNNGSVTMDRLDDMIRRIMTPYYQLQQTEYPAIDTSMSVENDYMSSEYNYTWTFNPAPIVDVRDDHGDFIRAAGAAGIVLLKNSNNTLPLKNPTDVGVFGSDAGDVENGLYFLSTEYAPGVLPVGGGSGTGRFSYVVPPLDAIKQKVGYKQNLVQYVLNNTAIIEGDGFSDLLPRPPEVCLVFLKTWASEGEDRTTLNVDFQGNEVVTTIADNCANTVVVTHSGGLNVMPWADHPNVTAILAAHYSGQEVGGSIVDVLWGDVNPSGRLPYTIAYNESDYEFADIENSTALAKTNDTNAWQSDFQERLLIDYRHFDYYNESVRYEFGFGLSYTTFSMSNAINIQSVSNNNSSSNGLSAHPPEAKIVPGGNPHLWDVLYTITATVSNTGSVAGTAVPQLYLGLPQPANQDTTPTKVLRGFDKVQLQPGQSASVEFELTRRDVSYWDIITQQWTIGQGAIKAYVGFSSRDIKATGSFSPLGSTAPTGYRRRRQ